jgi:hypothetical protein
MNNNMHLTTNISMATGHNFKKIQKNGTCSISKEKLFNATLNKMMTITRKLSFSLMLQSTTISQSRIDNWHRRHKTRKDIVSRSLVDQN